MVKNPNTLGLAIPPQNLKDCSVVELNPEAISIWIKTLQISELGETTKKIYHLLKESNQCELAFDVRFAILKIIQPLVEMILRKLEKYHLYQTGELQKKQIRIMHLDNTLKTQMANGYKAIIVSIVETQQQKSHQSILTDSIYHALFYFSKLFLSHAQHYTTSDPIFWKEVHTLYRLSETYKITNLKASGINSIENLYKQLVLFCAVNPFQFRQSEQKTLFDAIAHWLPYFSLQPIKQNDVLEKRADQFMIDLLSEDPPFCPKPDQQLNFSSKTKILNAAKLLIYFKDRHAQGKSEKKQSITLPLENNASVLQINTLEKLIKNLSKLRVRQNHRAQQAGEIRVTLGLSSTHYFLSDQKPFLKHAQSKLKDSNMIDPPSTVKQNQPHSATEIPMFSVEEHIEDKYGNKLDPEGLNYPENQLSELHFKIHKLDLVDISVSGYLLSWQHNQYPPIQPGDIMGLQTIETDSMSHWKIGVIRWLRYVNVDQIHIGVELLCTNAKAIGVQLLKKDKPIGFSLRSLLLYAEEDQDKEQILSLITPTLPFKEQDCVNLYLYEDEAPTKAVLNHTLESTGGYQNFSLQLKTAKKKLNLKDDLALFQKTHPPKNNTLKTNDNDSDDFDALWPNL